MQRSAETRHDANWAESTSTHEKSARVLFRRHHGRSFLTVVTNQSRNILPELHLLLSGLRVQVVQVHAHRLGPDVTQELELQSHDGGPLTDEQWGRVQAASMGYLGDRLMIRRAVPRIEVDQAQVESA